MIRQMGDAILRQVAQPINDVDAYRDVYADMLTQMQQAQGVGIAAPQIGIGIRAIYIASNPNPRYPDAPSMAPLLMINPQITSHSEVRSLDWEGCLSVSGYRGQVWRYDAVTASYLDAEGKQSEIHLTGFIARILQHECDHLDGILFVDRAIDSEDSPV